MPRGWGLTAALCVSACLVACDVQLERGEKRPDARAPAAGHVGREQIEADSPEQGKQSQALAESDASMPEAPSSPAAHANASEAHDTPAASCTKGCAAGNTGDSAAYQTRIRTYYIAAEEVDWDYAPDGKNVVMDKAFGDEENVFVQGNGVDRIGQRYRKALYREYTDESFETRKPRPEADQYLGLLGPIVHAVVGDTVHVVFRNAGSHSYSVHAHGVFYDKASEGAETNDGSGSADKLDDRVEPGATYTYTWKVTERAGPGPADPSSIVWLYHSHVVDGIADEYAGLVGAIVVTDAAHGTDSGVASDVDREITTLFMVDDENHSLFAADNIAHYAPMAKAEDPAFEESNLMHMINGYVYGNGPRLSVREGSHVRWYLLALGTEVDLHTPHWHGATVLYQGHRTDVVELLPASMHSVDMIPDNPGTWMFHCHVNDHIAAGMATLYDVEPAAK